MNLCGRQDLRFFGKSSGVILIQKAIDLKKEVTGYEESEERLFHPVDDYPVRPTDPDYGAYVLIILSSGNAPPRVSWSQSIRSLTRYWA